MSTKSKLETRQELLYRLEKNINPILLPIMKTIIDISDQNKLALYLVGGPLRDLLLERPIVDIDLVTEGNSQELANAVANKTTCRIISYPRFKTVTLHKNTARLDLATSRKESYKAPGSLPNVFSTDISQDLMRRDFTINAMALGISKINQATLIDPTNGLEDLSRKYIRALHSNSFTDDATRILRAIRYEQRLSFTIESQTLNWILKAQSNDIFSTITSDRLRKEIGLIFGEAQPLKVFKRGTKLKTLEAVFKPLSKFNCLKSESLHNQLDPLVWVGILAYGLTLDEGDEFILRLNMPKKWSRVVIDTIKLKSDISVFSKTALPIVQLCKLFDKKDISSLQAVSLINTGTQVQSNITQYLNHYRKVKPLLSGKDLIELGIPEGPLVGKLLNEIKLARLKGQISTKTEEKKMATMWPYKIPT